MQVGRASISNITGDIENDSTEVSQMSMASVKTNKVQADFRGSSTLGKKANAEDVNLEDFDIKMQLG